MAASRSAEVSSFQVQVPTSFTSPAPKPSPGRDSETAAPDGSATTETRPPPGVPNGSTSTAAPSSFALAVAWSTSSTQM
jgi:hypothetical protein